MTISDYKDVEMKLSREDLLHVYKVLSGDIKECNILSKDKPNRYKKRIEDNKKVLARIEVIIGCKIEYNFS